MEPPPAVARRGAAAAVVLPLVGDGGEEAVAPALVGQGEGGLAVGALHAHAGADTCSEYP